MSRKEREVRWRSFPNNCRYSHIQKTNSDVGYNVCKINATSINRRRYWRNERNEKQEKGWKQIQGGKKRNNELTSWSRVLEMVRAGRSIKCQIVWTRNFNTAFTTAHPMSHTPSTRYTVPPKTHFHIIPQLPRFLPLKPKYSPQHLVLRHHSR